ncbi:radical SAM family heme chaperone HemW [Phenylobacterium sp.]|uniref:radical SAM family heme chaperone HemW n=1 Tax=Phenylobacterium sp. TaxID=1871053 RepID=UPI0008B39CFB|nr:MAG: coproporphyrinogen III oxidase [Phenylobacterium sp. RIFCSPHIGHO2_01_FULL_70_10]
MSGPPPSLGVYVHWPYCARICPYCDFNVYRDRGRAKEQAALVAAIGRDLSAQAELTGSRRLVSVFFGGGTPSLMAPEAAGEILDLARSLWTPAEDLEVTLEANPTDAEAARFAAFAAVGVNRLSLGVQALDDAALAFLGRDHDAAAARRALQTAARAFPRLSLDLIYARPGQTAAAWRAELAEALSYGPEHVSPYQLTIEPGTAFDRAVRRGRIVPPADDVAAGLFETTQEVLSAAGFEAYEVSNHARGPAARSRHNLVYWQGEDYVGAGPGAHGRITRPEGRLATVAAARPADYIAEVGRTGAGFASQETLSAVEAAEERVLTGLRIEAGVAFAEVSALGLSPGHPRVTALREAGLIVQDDLRLRSTAAGRLVLDHVTRRLLV